MKLSNAAVIIVSTAISCSQGFVVPSERASKRSGAFGLFVTKPLAKEGDWGAYLDEENTGLIYYFNTKTGESLWQPPTNTFPEIRLSKDQKTLSQDKQNEYRAKTQPAKEAGGGFFSSILGGTERVEEKSGVVTSAETEEDKQPEEEKWFEGLFEEKNGGPDEPVAAKVKAKEAEESSQKNKGFFNILARGEATEEVTEEGEAEAEPKDTELPKKVQPLKKAEPFVVTKEQSEEGSGSTEGKKGFFSFLNKGTSPPPAPAQGKTEAATKEDEKTIQIDMSSIVIPHPAKVSWGGEDAVFIKGRNFGVFDGVSGADKLDGVPLYSTTLAKELKGSVGDDPLTIRDLTKFLTDAAEFADVSATGASTAIVGSLSEDGKLSVLNLGDSTCLVIRGDKVVAKTNEINHFFDCPYQLSDDSPDRPRQGTQLNVKVQKGDVVIMGSDGVFDNLTEGQILATVNSGAERASLLAKKIANTSRKVSFDESAETPYAKMAKKNGFEDYQDGLGGKVDDISCVVVRCK